LSFSNTLTLLATSTFAVVAKAAIPSIYKKKINKKMIIYHQWILYSTLSTYNIMHAFVRITHPR
jgi:hypothetical protein